MELWQTKYDVQTREITMIYRYEWDVGSIQWQEQVVDVTEIRDCIKALEDEGRGRLGQDDLFIRVDELLEVQLCHHAHLHLRYDEKESPLTRGLCAYWIRMSLPGSMPDATIC